MQGKQLVNGCWKPPVGPVEKGGGMRASSVGLLMMCDFRLRFTTTHSLFKEMVNVDILQF